MHKTAIRNITSRFSPIWRLIPFGIILGRSVGSTPAGEGHLRRLKACISISLYYKRAVIRYVCDTARRRERERYRTGLTTKRGTAARARATVYALCPERTRYLSFSSSPSCVLYGGHERLVVFLYFCISLSGVLYYCTISRLVWLTAWFLTFSTSLFTLNWFRGKFYIYTHAAGVYCGIYFF